MSELYAAFHATLLVNLAPTDLEKTITGDVDALFLLVLKAGASTLGSKMSNELFFIDIKNSQTQLINDAEVFPGIPVSSRWKK